jgi:GT2 family glycosyltransferase
MNSIDLSIVVASYNTKDLLSKCLLSIYDNTREINYEVIVVDDCSKDDSPQMVRECFPKAKLICNDVNLRYAKTNNIGLKAAAGRYGLLLNSDVEVQPSAFDNLVKFMDAHPDAAAAGPKLINPDGSIQHCIRSFPGLIPMIFQSLNLHLFWPNNPITNKYYNTDFDYSKAQVVDSIGTTSFIIRRSTWENYGMLDERFSLAFVDLAYCYMLKKQNQKIYYVPDAVVLHYGSQSINQSGIKEISLLHEALRRFYDLYYAPEDNILKRSLIRLGIKLREIINLMEYRISSNKRVWRSPNVSSASKRPIKPS